MIKDDKKFREVNKEYLIEKILLKNFKKGINKDINLITNAIGKKIYFQDLITTLVDGKQQSLIYLKTNLKSDKNVNIMSKIFHSYLKFNPYIFEFYKTNYSYYMINTSFLKKYDLDFLLEKITKKKTFIILKIEHNNFSNLLRYEELNNNSVLDMFEDIVYKIIFFYVLKLEIPFRRHINYITLYKYYEIKNMESKLNALIAKSRKIFNSSKLIDINKEIINLKNEIKNAKYQFDYEYKNMST